MVYSTEAAVRNQHPAIAASPDGAKAFVQRLVMQTETNSHRYVTHLRCLWEKMLVKLHVDQLLAWGK
ncbi:hypothetical protein KIN20_029283 [Parelaphostrongylus tenuis]|uniref:Uncharacterized protein n=1 Tax=Parelaphostrongylus tenuis TaxID=148309 RepID=A0AAD5R251_PARTN|nr:hypothetical protein KIN20_029283 [Parelaphostrongylus tenuis]